MTDIAIRRTGDIGKFIVGALIALFIFALLMLSASRRSAPVSTEVPLVPCKSCPTCVCPKALGSPSCGCPR